MPSLTDVKEQMSSLRYQAQQISLEAGVELDFSKVKCISGTTEDKITKWKALQMEMTELGAEQDRLTAIAAQMKLNEVQYQLDNAPVNSPPFGEGRSSMAVTPSGSIRKILDNSPEFKVLRERQAGTARIELPDYKTLITLTTISPQNDRRAPIRMRLEERTVMDAIGESAAASATVEWYEETTFTNAAVETAEGVAKPESALAWTLRTSAVKTIATWIPVTVQALQDNDFLESEIRNRLILMVQRREEQQVLTGDATGENLRGILATVGIQTQAKGADPVPTALFKGMQLVRGSAGSGFAEPDLIVMHPADYTEMMVLQTTAGDYLLQAILQQAPEARLWGLPIRQTTGMTQNTALIGAFDLGAEIFRRGGLSVAASTEHSTYFTENKVAVRAESRIALAVQVPTAFCSVTGI